MLNQIIFKLTDKKFILDNNFGYFQIKRLEKNYKDPNKMTIIFMDKKKRDIVFDDTRTREEFFQTVSQIKHIHKSEKDVKTVSVSRVETCYCYLF